MTAKTPFDQDRLTREEAAEYLGVAPATLSQWAYNGRQEIPYYPHGRRVYYRKADLDVWLESQRQVKAN